MPRNWDDIANTYEAWADVLDLILDEARTAVSSGDATRKVAAQQELREFRNRSGNAFAKPLDDIAQNAILDIWKATVTDALQGLAQRGLELQNNMRQISAITGGLASISASIRLDRAKAAIDSLTSAVTSISDLKNGIADGAGADDLRTKLAKAIADVQTIRNLIEGVRG